MTRITTLTRAAVVAGLAFALPAAAPAQTADGAAPAGGLVIVGGALRASNTAVYERFLRMAGGVEAARIGVIPAASGRPVRNATRFVDDMIALGVPADRLTIHPIAVSDNSGTDDVDESEWAQNGADPEVAAEIAAQTAIWIIGGDQMNLRQTLIDAEGTPLPAGQAVIDLLAGGGTVGGTSAGAAIMSDVMIASGDSLGALRDGTTPDYGSMDEQEYGPVHLNLGLGLFPYGILDQHFDRKARYGRLVVATDENRGRFPLGFGIEENTALIVQDGRGTVVGPGGVHVVDIGAAERTEGGFQNVRLAYFEEGDEWVFGEGYVNAAEKYDTIGGDEYFEVPDPSQTGAFSRNPSVKQLIGYDLIDNSAASEVSSYLFDPATDAGYVLTFSQDEATRGYWRALDGQADGYAYTDVRLDIVPATITVAR